MSLTKGQADKVKFRTDRFAVVEIPTVMGIKDAWEAIDFLLSTGYSIKGVIEREYMKTSYVLLTK